MLTCISHFNQKKNEKSVHHIWCHIRKFWRKVLLMAHRRLDEIRFLFIRHLKVGAKIVVRVKVSTFYTRRLKAGTKIVSRINWAHHLSCLGLKSLVPKLTIEAQSIWRYPIWKHSGLGLGLQSPMARLIPPKQMDSHCQKLLKIKTNYSCKIVRMDNVAAISTLAIHAKPYRIS